MASPRLTREQSREQTRERLVEAACAVFRERGYAAASIEDVTERAGYTRGAFYSNFKSKEELLIVLLARDQAKVMIEMRGIYASGGSQSEVEQRMLDYYSRMHETNECFLLWMEAKLLAARDAVFREAFLAHQRELRNAITAYVKEFSIRVGTPLPMPAEELAIGLIALCDGMQFAYAFDPQAITAEKTRQVLASFFGRIVLGGTQGDKKP